MVQMMFLLKHWITCLASLGVSVEVIMDFWCSLTALNRVQRGFSMHRFVYFFGAFTHPNG